LIRRLRVGEAALDQQLGGDRRAQVGELRQVDHRVPTRNSLWKPRFGTAG
jgi:hypothetical protein